MLASATCPKLVSWIIKLFERNPSRQWHTDVFSLFCLNYWGGNSSVTLVCCIAWHKEFGYWFGVLFLGCLLCTLQAGGLRVECLLWNHVRCSIPVGWKMEISRVPRWYSQILISTSESPVPVLKRNMIFHTAAITSWSCNGANKMWFLLPVPYCEWTF